MIKNRTCICCSARYSYCPDCGGADHLKPYWYSEFCSEECKDIWDIATRYNMQLMSKQEAKSALGKYDLSDTSKYVECVQRDITNIFADEKPVSKAKKAKTREVVKQESE